LLVFARKKIPKLSHHKIGEETLVLTQSGKKKKDSILCDTLVKEFIPKKAWCCEQITSRLSCAGPSWVSFTGEFSPNFNYGKMISTCSKDSS
jgi:hypothetical protein